MTVFLTGITGLLGQEIAHQFLEKGYRVRALVRNPENTTLENKNLEYVEGDILDVVALGEAIKGCQFAVHAAASVTFAPKERNHMYKTNVEGTATVVNACLSVQIEKLCQKTGMSKAEELMRELRDKLNQRRNSFEYDIRAATDVFCKLEFYIQNAKDMIL